MRLINVDVSTDSTMEGEFDFGISIVEDDVMKPVSDSST
jgi:hypothetical protein